MSYGHQRSLNGGADSERFDAYDAFQSNHRENPEASTSRVSDGGGFVVQGQVQLDGNTTEVITVSSDEEEADLPYDAYNDNPWAGPPAEEDIQLVKVLPKSKSRLLPPEPPSVDVTYDSAAIFTAASVTDYGHASSSTGTEEEEGWSLDIGVKTGYVKEYVDQAGGMGVIFSTESGLVLFNKNHSYSVDGQKQSSTSISTGSQVSFICYEIQSRRCRGWLTDDGFMRQAAAFWEPRLGANHASQALLRLVTEEAHKEELKKDFEAFLSHVKHNRFLPMALVRAQGQIVGYLNHKIGVIQTQAGQRPNSRVLFHSSDVYLYKLPLSASGVKQAIDVVLPVGLNVSFDARSVRGDDPLSAEMPFQACAVFAGTWPKVPHPTLLPGGPGSHAPVYDDVNDNTFYYLQLGLRENLDRKWKTVADTFGSNFRFVESRVAIRNGRDFSAWKAQYCPYPPQAQNSRRPRVRKKAENHHLFKHGVKKAFVIKKEAAENHVKEGPRIKTEPGVRVKRERVD